MTSYIIRRLFLGVVVIFLVSLLVFFLMRLLPGDPLQLYLGDQIGSYSEEAKAELREELHLNESVIQQYGRWLGDVVRGDLGNSIVYDYPVGSLIAERFPTTLLLAVLAIIVSGTLGPLLGTMAAVRRGKWQDYSASVFANVGITLPNFWVGILLILIFVHKLGWASVTEGFATEWLFPVISLSLFGLGAQTRQARSSMLEASHQDYIRTAWSKGLTERVVVRRHLVKNGLIPVVTTMGIQVGFLLGGAVLVENVFGVLGVGGLLADAIHSRDYPIVQGVVLLMSTIIVAVNLIVDVVYAWLDPRIRQSYR